MRRILSLVLVLVLLVPAAALAGTAVSGTLPANSSDIVDRLLNAFDFKFDEKKEGIGYGKCPVYTAPSEDAYRLADGKASVDTNDAMDVSGYDTSGWLLVRYRTNSGSTRVGYIPRKYIRGYKAKMPNLDFDPVPVRAAEEIWVTDNPRGNETNAAFFARLDAGEDFLILGKYTYTGNWWYIECTVDGQTARGFIDRDTSAFIADGVEYRSYKDLGIPGRSPEGTEPSGVVTVVYEENCIVRRSTSVESAMVARAHPGDQYPYYQVSGEWYRVWIDGVWGWIHSSLVRAD